MGPNPSELMARREMGCGDHRVHVAVDGKETVTLPYGNFSFRTPAIPLQFRADHEQS
jgi:hypothetical protein